jgi:UDP-glucose 4-epimerase
LLSSEERAYAVDSDDFFRVPLDSRGLDYAIYNELGSTVSDFSEAYTSHNTNRLDVGQIETLLSNLPEVAKEL